eukprot:5107205-Amphidinium_carterae.1
MSMNKSDRVLPRFNSTPSLGATCLGDDRSTVCSFGWQWRASEAFKLKKRQDKYAKGSAAYA